MSALASTLLAPCGDPAVPSLPATATGFAEAGNAPAGPFAQKGFPIILGDAMQAQDSGELENGKKKLNLNLVSAFPVVLPEAQARLSVLGFQDAVPSGIPSEDPPDLSNARAGLEGIPGEADVLGLRTGVSPRRLPEIPLTVSADNTIPAMSLITGLESPANAAVTGPAKKSGAPAEAPGKPANEAGRPANQPGAPAQGNDASSIPVAAPRLETVAQAIASGRADASRPDVQIDFSSAAELVERPEQTPLPESASPRPSPGAAWIFQPGVSEPGRAARCSSDEPLSTFNQPPPEAALPKVPSEPSDPGGIAFSARLVALSEKGAAPLHPIAAYPAQAGPAFAVRVAGENQELLVAVKGRRSVPSVSVAGEKQRVPPVPAANENPVAPPAISDSASPDFAPGGRVVPPAGVRPERPDDVEVPGHVIQPVVPPAQTSAETPVRTAGDASGRTETHSAAAEPRHAPAYRPSEPAGAVTAAHDIRLQVGGGEKRVDVRLTERGGEVQVAVRTPDPRLADVLRGDLPALSARLEQTGFRAEMWHPSAGVAEIHARAAASGPDGASPDPAGSGHRGSQDDRQPPPRQMPAPEAEGEPGAAPEGFSWLFSSLQ